MNIAVCEDISTDSGELCGYIRGYCDAHRYDSEISSFGTGEALLEAAAHKGFDIYFLDIFLPGMSGVDTARRIRETDRDCFIVFVTISRDFMPEGFEVFAAGYVVKPIDNEKMSQVMRNCRAVFERNSRMLDIPYKGESLKISAADILYVEVFDKECVFHMKRGNVKTRLPLDAVAEQLGGIPFLRCHRSFIVNMNHVDDMREDGFIMQGGDVVPIRKNGRREVRMAMAEFIAGPPFEVN